MKKKLVCLLMTMLFALLTACGDVPGSSQTLLSVLGEETDIDIDAVRSFSVDYFTFDDIYERKIDYSGDTLNQFRDAAKNCRLSGGGGVLKNEDTGTGYLFSAYSEDGEALFMFSISDGLLETVQGGTWFMSNKDELLGISGVDYTIPVEARDAEKEGIPLLEYLQGEGIDLYPLLDEMVGISTDGAYTVCSDPAVLEQFRTVLTDCRVLDQEFGLNSTQEEYYYTILDKNGATLLFFTIQGNYLLIEDGRYLIADSGAFRRIEGLEVSVRGGS